jgi:hypothetical protein
MKSVSRCDKLQLLYLVVCDTCASVLVVDPPEIIDLGADPEQQGAD